MGNQPSQHSLDGSVVSSTSAKGNRRKLSRAPFIKAIVDAQKASAALRNQSSSGTWFETSSALYTGERKVARKPMDRASLPQEQEGVQKVVTQTTRQPGADGKTYVVSTTTYYISSTSKPNGSESQRSSKSIEFRKPSTFSSIASSNASTYSSIDLHADGVLAQPVVMIDARQCIHAPGMAFQIPCDDAGSDRLYILHFLQKYALEGAFVAPATDRLKKAVMCTAGQPRPKVLDIGCGPGSWALEMAASFPQADFHGIHLCPIFPGATQPPNTCLHQYNSLDSIPYGDNTFDYIHIRLMFSYLTEAQATRMLLEIYRVLKPGGYVELRDVDYFIQRPGPVTEKIICQQLHALLASGHQTRHNLSSHVADYLKHRFHDVKQSSMTIPLGWGGQVGKVTRKHFEAYLQTIGPKIGDTVPSSKQTRYGVTETTINTILSECQMHQSYLNWFVCTGRKPVSKSNSSTMSRFSSLSRNVSTTGSEMCFKDTAWESIQEFADGFTDE